MREVERELLGQGVGFLGDILRLRVMSDDASVPSSVIAKLPKKANRGAGEMLGALLLVVPRLASYAAGGLIVIMVGALATVLVHDSSLGPVTPIVNKIGRAHV